MNCLVLSRSELARYNPVEKKPLLVDEQGLFAFV
jgi:hypothetical protein